MGHFPRQLVVHALFAGSRDGQRAIRIRRVAGRSVGARLGKPVSAKISTPYVVSLRRALGLGAICMYAHVISNVKETDQATPI